MDRPGHRADPTQRPVRRPGPGRATALKRWRAWWDALPDPERFRIYTRGVSEVTTIAIAVAMAVAVPDPRLIAAVVIVAVAASLNLESRPELATWMAATWRTRARRIGIGLLVAVAAANALVVRTAADPTLAAEAGAVGVFALAVLTMSVVPFLTYRWWVAVGLGLLAGPAYGDTPWTMVSIAALSVVINGVMVVLMLQTLWGLRVVDDLERARSTESELKVAQERLRFARDLHDVVGRGFSAVAVKSELAGTFIRFGDTDRASAELDDVNALAVESMEQMRDLVRGYRDISLASEVAGARSLLSAAGCRLTVAGAADHVPRMFHEVAAWVVREGTTNIVKHSSATEATLALGADGMTLSNDDAADVGPARSGHTGLAERLDAVGATMSVAVDDGHYALRVRWETS